MYVHKICFELYTKRFGTATLVAFQKKRNMEVKMLVAKKKLRDKTKAVIRVCVQGILLPHSTYHTQYFYLQEENKKFRFLKQFGPNWHDSSEVCRLTNFPNKTIQSSLRLKPFLKRN